MKMTVYGVRIATILLVIYWIAVFTGTHLPKVHIPGPQNTDKVIHFGAFTVLAFLMAWAIPTRMGQPNWNVLISAAVCMSYAAFDEFTQIPVGRTADLNDWLADCAGITFGLTVYLVTRTLLWRRQRLLKAALSTTR
jgi:VanZ family protein